MRKKNYIILLFEGRGRENNACRRIFETKWPRYELLAHTVYTFNILHNPLACVYYCNIMFDLRIDRDHRRVVYLWGTKRTRDVLY